MIAFLTGQLAEKGPDHAVLDVGGVGYRVVMSSNSLAALPAVGDSVKVLTYMQVREDDVSLFGFENAREKALFARLITVSGVGPKVALAALSSFEPEALVSAIASEDVAVVSSIPGVGKKTAQRIILELRDKLEPLGGGAGAGGIADGSSAYADVREALSGMGFAPGEIAAAAKGFDGRPDDAAALLAYALKRLGGGS